MAARPTERKAVAEAAGARVVVERRRATGAPAPPARQRPAPDVLVFLDGDGSDDPPGLRSCCVRCSRGARRSPSARGTARARRAARRTSGSGTGWSRCSCGSVYGVRVRDMPPMRAIRRDALERLGLREMTYGWPTEMIVKAARAGLPIAEVEVALARPPGRRVEDRRPRAALRPGGRADARGRGSLRVTRFPLWAGRMRSGPTLGI